MSSSSGTVVLYTTWPDAETAERVGAEAVAERLSACVNVLAPIRSIYRWEGAVDRTVETPALFKTTGEACDRLRDFLLSRHPYETPAMLALPVLPDGSNPDFLAWISAEIGQTRPVGSGS
ncbi:MAG: divalent-cation tolerance protein CutA [Caulobacteraceae bacterium]|nr:divalent-cation tolerance protein CutA [Caulobacteraceae bacterium]